MPKLSQRTSWNRAENAFTALLADRRGRGLPIVDLTESNPTKCGFPAAVSSELLTELGHPRGVVYDPASLGHPVARGAVAAYYQERGVVVPPDRIALTASTSEAYGWLFKLLCEVGDEVLVATPSYPLFSYLAALEEVRLVPFALSREERWRVDLDGLRRAISERTRAILVVHPNNPTGSFVRRDDARALEEIAVEHGLALIVDEVFGDYAHGPLPADRLPTFARDAAALTFVLSGLSKIVALPQVKLAWAAAFGPREIVEEAMARLEIIADTYLSVATPVQLALPAILARRGEIQAAILARVCANVRALDAAVAAHGPGVIARRLPVDGGWYATLEVARTRNEDEWAAILAEREGIVVHPGYFFDFHAEGVLVVSLLPEERRFADAAERMLAVLERLA